LAVTSSTVRGWLRRFTALAEPIRAGFTVLARDLDPDPPPIGATGSVFADAAGAVLSAASAAAVRWPFVLAVSAWEFAGAGLRSPAPSAVPPSGTRGFLGTHLGMTGRLSDYGPEAMKAVTM
jgi:hypothetical protein